MELELELELERDGASRVRPWRPAILAVAASCVLVACGGADPVGSELALQTSAALPASERPRVVVLGDSLTEGLGLQADEAFPAVLQARLEREGYGVDVVNAGVSGDTTAGGVRRLDWALDGDVRVVIVALGGNDGLRGLPAEAMRENLTTIVTRTLDRGAAVIVAGMEAPPNYGPAYTAAFREVFSEVASDHDVTFVPFLLEGIAGVRELNQADDIHPTAEGARRIADNLWPALVPLVQSTATPAQ